MLDHQDQYKIEENNVMAMRHFPNWKFAPARGHTI
jgi:hypothetical protein